MTTCFFFSWSTTDSVIRFVGSCWKIRKCLQYRTNLRLHSEMNPHDVAQTVKHIFQNVKRNQNLILLINSFSICKLHIQKSNIIQFIGTCALLLMQSITLHASHKWCIHVWYDQRAVHFGVRKFEIEIKISATNLWINPNEMMFNDENHHWNYTNRAHIFIVGVIKNRKFQNNKPRMFWLAIDENKMSKESFVEWLEHDLNGQIMEGKLFICDICSPPPKFVQLRYDKNIIPGKWLIMDHFLFFSYFFCVLDWFSSTNSQIEADWYGWWMNIEHSREFCSWNLLNLT